MRQPLCEHCLVKGLVRPADTVDHVEPHNGDYHRFWYGAVQSLCRQCHEERHGRGNTRPWIGPDGWPIEDPGHHRQGVDITAQWEATDDDDEDE